MLSHLSVAVLPGVHLSFLVFVSRWVGTSEVEENAGEVGEVAGHVRGRRIAADPGLTLGEHRPDLVEHRRFPREHSSQRVEATRRRVGEVLSGGVALEDRGDVPLDRRDDVGTAAHEVPEVEKVLCLFRVRADDCTAGAGLAASGGRVWNVAALLRT